MVKILVMGAHPDDCDFFAGGTAALWKRRGDLVRFVSLTNGNAGHQTLEAGALAKRRRGEAEAAGKVIGMDYEVLENDDGKLAPTLERRLEVIRLIRRFCPDLVLTHRPNDYHPDHRYTSILVQDSAYMVTVPKICPEVPHLASNPVFGYLQDDFQKPNAFSPDVVVDVDPVMETKWSLLHAHRSQFYEWLPFNDGTSHEVPASDADRKEWLKKRWRSRLQAVADKYREKLVQFYGGDHAHDVEYAEAFEISEYGARPGAQGLRELFPLP